MFEKRTSRAYRSKIREQEERNSGEHLPTTNLHEFCTRLDWRARRAQNCGRWVARGPGKEERGKRRKAKKEAGRLGAI